MDLKLRSTLSKLLRTCAKMPSNLNTTKDAVSVTQHTMRSHAGAGRRELVDTIICLSLSERCLIEGEEPSWRGVCQSFRPCITPDQVIVLGAFGVIEEAERSLTPEARFELILGCVWDA